jgi:hypothetical protein
MREGLERVSREFTQWIALPRVGRGASEMILFSFGLGYGLLAILHTSEDFFPF